MREPTILTEILEKRFFKKIVKTKSCWEWVGTKNHYGYGMFYINLKGHRAHRVSWMHKNKKAIGKGKFVCHSCDNPACVNPAHLWVGSPKDNSQDSVNKGRNSPPPLKKKRSHCKYGHEMKRGNLYCYTYKGKDYRICMMCAKKRAKARKLRLKKEKKQWKPQV